MSPREDSWSIDRRSFLGVAGALSAGLAAPAIGREGRRSRGGATNVIFMVSDGMSFGTLQLADAHLHRTTGAHTNWRSLWSRGDIRRSIMQTYSADGFVTDSAAAGSAWGGGEHINNGAINVTADGRSLTPICFRTTKNTKGTGLVTTTRITHATPASFVANVQKRDMENDIAQQQLERRVDVLLGGGAKHFPADLIAANPDYTHVANSDSMHSAGGDRLLGLFQSGHMSYVLDRLNDNRTSEPTLADMTRVALRRLSQNPNGFLLQIEGGRVDHCAHANDAGSLIAEQLAFDEAVGVVLEFAQNHNDTLVVITTDHGNANPGLSLYGRDGDKAFENIGKARFSFDWIFEQIGRAGDQPARKAAAPQIIEHATGITLTNDEIATFNEALDGLRVDPFGPANGPMLVLGSLLANHHGVAFLSPNHTADFVELTSFGPGSELIDPMVDNIELNRVMVESLDLAPVSIDG